MLVISFCCGLITSLLRVCSRILLRFVYCFSLNIIVKIISLFLTIIFVVILASFSSHYPLVRYEYHHLISLHLFLILIHILHCFLSEVQSYTCITPFSFLRIILVSLLFDFSLSLSRILLNYFILFS